MLRTLSRIQVLLGVLLLLPPAYFFGRVRPELNRVAADTQTRGEIVARSLQSGVALTESLAETFQTVGQKAGSIADTLAKIPFSDWIAYLGPTVKATRGIGERCQQTARTLNDSAASLAAGRETLRDIPKAITSLAETATVLSVVALLAGVVVILNGLQLMALDKRLTKTTVLILLAGLASLPVQAENWPCWRGPRGDGSSAEASVPLQWSSTNNIVWKTAIPGRGHGSPIVWGDRIFLLTAIEDQEQRRVVCVNRTTGRIAWQRTVLVSPLERKHTLNSFASSTPATDGTLVYVTFLDKEEMVVAAYDFAGNQKWIVRPGPFASKHGFCSSPVLFKDKVIINGDHDGDSYIVALDRQTGKTLWKIDRENKTRSYCTPIIRELAGKTQMILSGSKCVASYDPNTGQRHWIIDGPTEQMVASMVYNEKADMLCYTGGFPKFHVLGIKPDGQGNVTQTHEAWRSTHHPSYVPAPVSIGEHFVVISDTGTVSCYQARDGQLLWSERLEAEHASLVTAGNLIYCLADSGLTTVLKDGPEFQVVAHNELGEKCFASPAISDGQLFLRSDNHLFCIGARP